MPPLVNVVDAEIWTFEESSQNYSEIFDLFTIDTTQACSIVSAWYWTTVSSPTPIFLSNSGFMLKDDAENEITYSPTLSTQVDTYTISYRLRIEGE